MRQPDISPSLSREEWEKRCAYYAEDAFYCPPDKFLFRHYDESQVLECERGVVGANYAGDVYFVRGHSEVGYYGAYSTRDIAYYLKSGTWIEVPSEEHFARRRVDSLSQELADAERELLAIRSKA